MQTEREYIPHRVGKGNRPKIEEIICYCLDGNLRQSALDFASWLRENGMKITLHSSTTRGHNAKYKDKYMCLMLFESSDEWKYVKNRTPDDLQYWSVNMQLWNFSKYENIIRNEGLAQLSWKPNYCAHKKQPDKPLINNTCNACSVKGVDKLVFGEDFLQCCIGFPAVKNPDEAELARIKRLLVLEKEARDNIRSNFILST